MLFKIAHSGGEDRFEAFDRDEARAIFRRRKRAGRLKRASLLLCQKHKPNRTSPLVEVWQEVSCA